MRFSEADTGLDAFNKDSFAARWNLRFCHLGTMYQDNKKSCNRPEGR